MQQNEVPMGSTIFLHFFAYLVPNPSPGHQEHQLPDDDVDEEEDNKVEDNNKDDNDNKGISALRLDRHQGFSRGYQGHQGHWPHWPDDDDKKDDNQVEDNDMEDNDDKGISLWK